MLKIGTIVTTEHGIGTVVGYACEDSSITETRLVVQFPEPPLHFDGHPFSFSKLCYLEKEVRVAEQGNDTPTIWNRETRNTFNKYSATYCGKTHP